MLTLVLTALLAMGGVEPQGCTTPDPFVALGGGTCVGGGWFPPGYPGIGTTPPVVQTPPIQSINPFMFPITDPSGPLTGDGEFWTNERLLEHAQTGEPLPNRIIWFHAPLVIRNAALFRGGGKTLLVPINALAGPQIIIETSTDFTWRQRIESFLVVCVTPGQAGITVNGHNMAIERVQVWGCDEGISFPGFAVNIAVRDSRFDGNRTGILIMGHGVSPVWGSNSVTTLRFSGVHVGGSSLHGVRMGHGMNVVFDDSSIIEGNPGIGVFITPTFPGAYCTLILRDVWFELNGQHISDPIGCVSQQGVTGVH